MITTEKAFTRVADFSEAELREAVSKAMFDGFTLTPAGVRDAQPEDIFVALLARGDSLQRRAVVEGCRAVCGSLLKFLNEPTLPPDSRWEHAFAHFAALLGAARPPELERQVRSLLQLALDEAVPITVRNPIVRAALAYAQSEADAPYWLGHIEGTLIPGYAFQALLRINPLHPRLEGYLSALWRRALRGEVRLRVPLFAQELAKHQFEPDACLRRVFRGVLEDAPELRETLRKDCARYPHSASWENLFPSETTPLSLSHINLTQSKARLCVTTGSESSDIRELLVRAMENYLMSTLKIVIPQSTVAGKSGLFIENFEPTIIHRKISAGGRYGYTQHLVSVLHQPNTIAEELVETCLARSTANLPAQIALFASSQRPAAIK